VPLQDLVDKFSHVRFEPAGMTKNPDVRFAKSIVDYIFRWMAVKFLSPEAQYAAGVNVREETTTPEQLVLDVAASAPSPPGASASQGQASAARKSSFAAIQNQEDAPPCSTCGSIMVRSGACYKCTNCGTTSGCA
jgi:ribonucleoside-diphosphate reductase alpha chain